MTMLAPLALEPLHFKTDGVSGTFQKCVDDYFACRV